MTRKRKIGSNSEMRVSFIGKNAENVTGSMVLVEYGEIKVLLEAGIYQTNNKLEDYRVNSRNLNIDLKRIDYVVIGHIHADHSMLVPRLVSEGFKGRIVVPEGNRGFFEIMGLDSAYIVERDCKWMEKKYNKTFKKVYTEKDVNKAVAMIEEYVYNEKVELGRGLSVRFRPSGHIINSAQVEMWFGEKERAKKLLYTSDLGNIKAQKYYTKPFERVETADVVIGEATYGDKGREVGKKQRKEDMHTLKETIDHTEGVVEIPVFAMDRCQNILTFLYDIYGKDSSFTKEIIVDSPLTVKMLREYERVLEGESYLKFREVMAWDKVRLIDDWQDSLNCREEVQRAVVLTAAGMLGNGRSKEWLKKIVSKESNTVIFVGYADENTIGGQLKREHGGYIDIDGETYSVKCNIVTLNSFTSHMQYSDLLDYYSSIEAKRVCIVHGSKTTKSDFEDALEKLLRVKGRDTVVERVTEKKIVVF